MPEKMIDIFGITQIPESRYREALRCEKCGHDTYADSWGERLCEFGNCVELYCKGCGYSNGGWGPVGCECQRTHSRQSANLRKINTILRRRNRRRERRKRRLETHAD